MVAYVYAPDRKGERPKAHLAGFTGVLQVDGYAGYRALAGENDVQLAFCWAHVEDTARGHIQAMEQGKPGETYIITGPRHTFESVFDLAASMASVKIGRAHV